MIICNKNTISTAYTNTPYHAAQCNFIFRCHWIQSAFQPIAKQKYRTKTKFNAYHAFSRPIHRSPFAWVVTVIRRFGRWTCMPVKFTSSHKVEKPTKAYWQHKFYRASDKSSHHIWNSEDAIWFLFTFRFVDTIT